MPRAANNRDGAVIFFGGIGDFSTHVRLALCLARIRRVVLAQRSHCVADGFKNATWVGVFFDQIRPPAFAVFITSRRSQSANGIAGNSVILWPLFF